MTLEQSVTVPHHKEPTPLRGLLSRLRRRTTSEAAADEGWVHHDSEDGTGFSGWLYHYADGAMAAEDGTVYEFSHSGAVVDTRPEPGPEPEPEPAPGPEPEPEPAAEDEDQDIPVFAEYSPSDLPSYLLGATVVIASVAAVLALFRVAPAPSAGGFVVVICLAAIAVAAGWGLASWQPTIVSIRDGVLEVARAGREEEFDLRDPATRVELGRDPGSPRWKATVTRPDGRAATIDARQVKARHFTRIVEHHRHRLRGPEQDRREDG
jgi:hypothetical protein